MDCVHAAQKPVPYRTRNAVQQITGARQFADAKGSGAAFAAQRQGARHDHSRTGLRACTL